MSDSSCNCCCCQYSTPPWWVTMGFVPPYGLQGQPAMPPARPPPPPVVGATPPAPGGGATPGGTPGTGGIGGILNPLNPLGPLGPIVSGLGGLLSGLLLIQAHAMNQDDKNLTLLQVVVHTDTPLPVAAMIKILEILGIVSSPELVSAMQLAVAIIPPTAQATLFGFVKVLGNLVKHHPKATKAHHDALAELLKTLASAQDAPLTFGPFLTLCEALLKAPAHKPAKAA